MSTITDARKNEIIKEHAKHEGDTGSAEVQVALLTDRINHLTEHFKVGRRRRLLGYLRDIDIERYRALIKALNLRH